MNGGIQGIDHFKSTFSSLSIVKNNAEIEQAIRGAQESFKNTVGSPVESCPYAGNSREGEMPKLNFLSETKSLGKTLDLALLNQHVANSKLKGGLAAKSYYKTNPYLGNYVTVATVGIDMLDAHSSHKSLMKESPTEYTGRMGYETTKATSKVVFGKVGAKGGAILGAKAGAAIGVLFPPAGPAIFGGAGAVVGAFSGGSIGASVVEKGAQFLSEAGVTAEAVGKGLSGVASDAEDAVKSVGKSVKDSGAAFGRWLRGDTRN
jgi:hypothetical protein